MTVAIDSDSANIVAVRFTDQGSDPASPTAGGHKVYTKSGGVYSIDSSGNVKLLMVNPLTTEGDLVYQHSSAPTRLAVGSNHQVLVSDGTDPGWGAVPPDFTNSVEVLAKDFAPYGFGGSTQASRYVGATLTGAPATGTYAVGDFVIAQDGVIWVCITAGTPGTWSPSTASALSTEGDLLYFHSSSPARLAVGANHTILVSNGTDPSWSGTPTISGELIAADFAPSGLTGSVAATRYVGGTASVAPTTGAHAVGDWVITQAGHVFICTVAGTPGTWVDAGGAGSLVTSVFGRSGAVVAASADYTAAQVTNAADVSSGSQQNFTGEVKSPDFTADGLTGATQASRYVGATTSGAPGSGTFSTGDFVIARNGHIFVCSSGGSPGTWVDVGSVANQVTSVFSRTGAVVAASADYTAAQVTNAADKSSGSQQNFTGEVKSPDFVAGGLTGATAASRYVGATASGAPASGTFAVGDYIIAQNGHIFVCTVAGTPGTWVDAGSNGNLVTSVFSRTGAVSATSGDYTAAQVTNAADVSSGSQQNFTGEVKSPDFVAGGLTGATQASRYVGATTSGAPASGTFAVGDFAVCQDGSFYVCTTAGSPGTWTHVTAGASGYTTVDDEGSALTQRSTINVVGRGIIADDNSSQTRLRVSDPYSMTYEFDEMYTSSTSNAQIAKLGWAFTTGTGASLTTIASEAGHPGIYRMNGSTSANTPIAVTLGATAATVVNSDTFDMLLIIRPTDVDNITTIRCGLMGTVGGNPPTNGIYIEGLSSDFGSGVMAWFGVTRSGGSQNRSTTIGSTAANAWMTCRIRRTNGTTIGFTLNGGTEQTLSSTIPADAGAVQFQILSTSSSNARHLDIDLWDLLITGLSR